MVSAAGYSNMEKHTLGSSNLRLLVAVSPAVQKWQLLDPVAAEVTVGGVFACHCGTNGSPGPAFEQS